MITSFLIDDQRSAGAEINPICAIFYKKIWISDGGKSGFLFKMPYCSKLFFFQTDLRRNSCSVAQKMEIYGNKGRGLTGKNVSGASFRQDFRLKLKKRKGVWQIYLSVLHLAV